MLLILLLYIFFDNIVRIVTVINHNLILTTFLFYRLNMPFNRQALKEKNEWVYHEKNEMQHLTPWLQVLYNFYNTLIPTSYHKDDMN